MPSTIQYAISHYAIFAVFLWAFWGAGQITLHKILNLKVEDPFLGAVLAVAIGQGLFIVTLQFLAIGGFLEKTWIITFLAIAGLLAILEWRNTKKSFLTRLNLAWKGLSRSQQASIVLILIYSLPTIFAPLRAPLQGDETTYHLPHAQQWAQSGILTVNEWLRYPWFPYNYNLLYAGAFTIYGDVFTHIFHSLAGWLVAIMTYRLGVRYFTRAAGCVAVLIWLQLNRGDFGKGIVDMGLTLYILAALITFYWWIHEPESRRWLGISCFLMGIAVGSKYQALFFLPFLGLTLILVDRRPTTLVIALVFLIIPCGYWYARNTIMTGDPFNPLGGKLFGFTEWNLADYDYQFADLKRQASWPSLLLWPAVIALWRPLKDKPSAQISTILICTYFFIIWMVTSRYPRYLMPIFPLLALLAATQWCDFFKLIANRLSAYVSQERLRIISKTVWVLILVITTISSATSSKQNWSQITINQKARNVLLANEIRGFQVLQYAKQHPMGRIYLSGILGDAVYYAPHPIWGDVFGPWRYQDILSSNPKTFSRELLLRNFDATIIDESLGKELEAHTDFQQYFSLVFKDDGVFLYRVVKPIL